MVRLTFRITNSLVKMSLKPSRRAEKDESKENSLISDLPYVSREAAFGLPRNFLSNRFVYAVFSSRAGGLSVGINMVPGKICNFHCIYCEVNREEPGQGPLSVAQMGEELRGLLGFIQSGDMARHPQYRNLPPKLLELRQVALSGDGEPTLAPNFLEAVQAVIHVRATSPPPPGGHPESFPAIDGVPPPESAIRKYVERLNLLKSHQAQIQLVQIYSVVRPAIDSRVTHLPLKDLANIARIVRQETGLRVEVF